MNGRYQFHNTIGKGSMGIVHRATDRLTGEIVALKQVHVPTVALEYNSLSDLDTDYARRMALAQEFQLMAGLRHPHIISVLDYGFAAQQMPFFTMTYLPSAQTILQAGLALNIDDKITLIQQLLQALAYLHRQGIIHRDLKPNNVLVSAQKVRVLDFGLSVRQNGGQEATSGGTLLYMAPELLRREQATVASDLYAVGVMVYELLAGRHPFDSKSGQFARQVQADEPDLTLLGVDDGLAAVVGRLLAKEPAERYSSAQACLNAISAALGEPVAADSTAIRESYLQAATFVGREAEMKQLRTALNETQEGPGAVWLIGGESGVGKTRLLDEFRANALVAGWQVMIGQAVAEGGFPYQLWREIVPHLILDAELDDLEAGVLRQIAPSIDRLFTREIPEPPALQGREAQQRLVFTLIDVLRQQTQPTLLLLEDLQWVRESLAPLKHILNVIDQLPNVMVVGTYRNDERPALLDELPGSHSLQLERLTETQIEQLSRVMLGEGTSSPEIVSFVVQETEGNTFFIVEVIRALAEEAGRLDEVGQTELPSEVFTSGMQHLLQRRIARVPQRDHGLLQLAAVAGRQLDFRVLRHLNMEADVEEWVQRVAETAVFTIENGQWQFAHDKLREAILEKLDNEARRPLHHQVAEAIEHIYPDDEAYNQILLEHWYQADKPEKELTYILPVAEYLVEITAQYDHARILLERGIQYLSVDDARQVSLLNLQAQSYFRQGNTNLAHKLTQQAWELAQQVNDQQGAGLSLNNLGIVAQLQGNYEQSRNYFQQGLAIHRTIEDMQGINKSLIGLGSVAYSQGDYEQARDYFQQSLTICRIIGDQQGIGTCLNNLGVLARDQGEYEQAHDYHQQSLPIMQTIGDQRGVGVILNNLGIVTSNQGNYEQAHDYYQQSLAIRQAIGDQRGVGTSLNNLGVLARDQGEYEQARDYYQQSMTIKQAIGDQRGISYSLNNLGDIYFYRGEYEQACDHYQQSLAIKQAIGDKYGAAYSFNHLGFAYLQLGDEQARHSFWDALFIAQSIQSLSLLLEATVGFAWLYYQEGQSSRAVELVGLVQHHLEKQSDVQGRLDMFLPLLEEALNPTELEAAMERGKGVDLDVVVQELLDVFGEGEGEE